MMRAVHGSTVLYPSDGNQTAKLVAQMADRDGITYMRTTREKTAIVYDKGESFPIGGSKVIRGGVVDRDARGRGFGCHVKRLEPGGGV